MKKFLLFAVLFTVGIGSTLRAADVLKEWNFDTAGDFEGWNGGGMSEMKVENGVFSALYSSRDPYFISPVFDIKPQAGQYVEIRMKTVTIGEGEFFFASDDKGPYGGFSEEMTAFWKIRSDGEWHVYRIFPAWSKLPKLHKIRLDFGTPAESQINKESVELDYVKIVDLDLANLPKVKPDWTFNQGTTGWEVENGTAEKTDEGWQLESFVEKDTTAAILYSDYFALDVGLALQCVSVTMKNAGPGAAVLFLGDKASGEVTCPIDVDSDDEGFVTYNLSMVGNERWDGRIFRLGIRGGCSGDKPIVQRVSVGIEPVGKAQLRVSDIGLSDAINRSETPLPLALLIKNIGGQTAKNIRISFPDLPEGFSILLNGKPVASNVVELGSLEPFDIIGGGYELEKKTIQMVSQKPYRGKINYRITADDTMTRNGTFEVDITASLHLPKADYVPEPEKVELQDPDLEIGALYFPGWSSRADWERIRASQPIRKPVLGWYDEGNPEVVDWQIKWAKEAGISFFLVDWYWSRGHISLEHWVKAFQKARYRDQFKWAMMWANHNGPGSHSVADQEAVTKYWIDNYFNTPEYYTIDGKPVVMIWSAEGMDNDLKAEARKQLGREPKKGEGVRILLETSRRIAQEAGFPGIYFIAMKWSESSTAAESIEWLKDAGFDMTSIYHYMNPGQETENPRLFDFDLIVRSSLPWWRARYETGILPFLPNLSTGWDDRPWNNHLVIANRTPEKFRKICNDLKTFVAESGIKRICLAPLNEWGEGSYAEPNREFGFGMYEALRETFCKEPAGGWPLYYGPGDVGLGPYDYPVETMKYETAWTFDGESTPWRGFMGLEQESLKDGTLTAVSNSRDPAFHCRLAKVPAADFSKLKIRMKLTPQDGKVFTDTAIIFWGTLTTPVFGGQSVTQTVQGDGEFHDYVFDLKSSPRWQGKITTLRFDPTNNPGVTISIESIELLK